MHRDVKPSNLLFDDQGRVKVSDLGLAQAPGGPSRRSLAGSAALPHPGTPGYKSPEQEQTTNYLTPASDVYGLGVVLFEMLTGRVYGNLKPGTRLSKLCAAAPAWLDELRPGCWRMTRRARPWDGAELLERLEEGPRIAAEQRIAAERAGRKPNGRRPRPRRTARPSSGSKRKKPSKRAGRRPNVRRGQGQAEAKATTGLWLRRNGSAKTEPRQAELKRQQEAAEAVRRQAEEGRGLQANPTGLAAHRHRADPDSGRRVPVRR